MTYFARIEKNGDIFDIVGTNDLQKAREAARRELERSTKADKVARIFIDGYENPVNIEDAVCLPDADFYEEVKSDYDIVQEVFDGKYTDLGSITVECDGKTLTGLMFGNDECFDGNAFYQYLIADRIIYKCYYNLLDEDGEPVEIDCIDYTHAIDIVEM